ncbi:MAG: PH domain-containing protein [Marmoricola sp.]
MSDEVLPYRRLSPLTPIAKSGVWLAAAAFTVGRDIMNGRRELSMLAVVAGAIVGLGLVSGFASWWRTKFRISDTELLIESGLISRHSRRVRLDRIVAIDINQPFIARLLGVAELRIETGTTDSEARLAYLPVAEATSMRHTLLAHRQAPGELTPEDAAAGPVPPVAPLVRVPLQWHLISIFARPESILFVNRRTDSDHLEILWLRPHRVWVLVGCRGWAGLVAGHQVDRAMELGVGGRADGAASASRHVQCDHPDLPCGQAAGPSSARARDVEAVGTGLPAGLDCWWSQG